MALNLRTGKFLVQKYNQQDEGFLGNFLDSKALYDYFDQPEVALLNEGIAQLIATADDDLEEASFLDRLMAGAQQYTVNKPKIEYRLRGNSKVRFRLTKTFAGTNPGLRHTNFTLEWDTNLLKPGDRMAPTEAPLQQVIIQSMPRKAGDGWAYDVRYATNNPHMYFPTEYLSEYERWEVAGSSVYGENSSDWGSTIMHKGNSVLRFRVPLWMTGQELMLTDEVIKQGQIVAMETKDGRTPMEDGNMLVTTVAEQKFNQEIRVKKDKDLTWGVSTEAVPDTSSQRRRRVGAGVFDFARDGHVKRYSTSPWNSSIDEITNFMDPIFDMKSPAEARVMFETGKMGIEWADQVISYKFGEKAAIRDVKDFIERIGNTVPGGTEAFKLKMPAFKAYEFPTYGLVEFNHWSTLDNRAKGGPFHPRTGKPIMSYWHIGWDIGYGSGIDSNVAFVQRENSTVWAYQANAWSFDGPVNDKQGGRYRMVSGARNAVLRHGDEYGLFIKDLNKMLWLLPNIKV